MVSGGLTTGQCSNSKLYHHKSPGPVLKECHSHKTFLHFHNVGPTSSKLVQHCINDIQMLCAFWDVMGEDITMVLVPVVFQCWHDWGTPCHKGITQLTRDFATVVPMFVQRPRRCPNIEPRLALDPILVYIVGMALSLAWTHSQTWWYMMKLIQGYTKVRIPWQREVLS